MTSRRVIQWGTGAVGLQSLQFVLGSGDLELVGVKCYTEGKEGMDAGELAGCPPTGVVATRDGAAVLALDADCVLFMPRDTFLDPTVPASASGAWVDEVVPILESGKNVVSPLQSAMHWRHLADGAALRERLETACQRGGASLFFTGLDPGFVSDCLAITLSSASGEITQVRTTEVIDYETYATPSVLKSMGFGVPVQDLSSTANDSLVPSWGCALWLVADSLGVELEDIVLATGRLRLAGRLHLARWTHVRCGCCRRHAMVAHGHGRRGSRESSPITSAGSAPDGARVAHASERKAAIASRSTVRHRLRTELALGLEGGTGTCLGDAVVMTAARCVNAIAAVVRHPAGYHLLTSDADHRRLRHEPGRTNPNPSDERHCGCVSERGVRDQEVDSGVSDTRTLTSWKSSDMSKVTFLPAAGGRSPRPGCRTGSRPRP